MSTAPASAATSPNKCGLAWALRFATELVAWVATGTQFSPEQLKLVEIGVLAGASEMQKAEILGRM